MLNSGGKGEKMRRLRIYQAAGWFDEEQRKQYEEVYSVLREIEEGGLIDLFAPQYDGIVLKPEEFKNKKKMQTVFWLDVEMLKRADILTVNTINKDTGSIVEAGMGIALGKKIICYNSTPEHGLNVMLSAPAAAFVKNKEDLLAAVLSGVKAYEAGKLEGWQFNLFEGIPI